MNVESFRGRIGKIHEIRLAQILNIPINTLEHHGVDLLNHIGVEVKSCLINPKSDDCKKNYAKWTLFDYQLTWHEKYDVPLYCAIGTYQLDIPRSRIWTKDLDRLEDHVTEREFWVAPWSWTLEFPIKHGEHHDYRYLRRNPHTRTEISPLPRVTDTIHIPKGLLHFTEGVDIDLFK